MFFKDLEEDSINKFQLTIETDSVNGKEFLVFSPYAYSRGEMSQFKVQIPTQMNALNFVNWMRETADKLEKKFERELMINGVDSEDSFDKED